MNPQITIVNLETGEEITRDMNAEELAQMTLDQAEAAEKTAARAQAEAARTAAESKLAALGLDVDDLKALGL
jgi:hypothetical protein